MFKRLGHLLLIVALLAATGGHWAVLQSVAWTTMIAANLSTESFSDAVKNTFDGQHPCSLCQAVSTGKKSEQKSEAPAPELKKFEYVNESPRFAFAAPLQFILLPEFQAVLRERNLSPPVPPPRAA